MMQTSVGDDANLCRSTIHIGQMKKSGFRTLPAASLSEIPHGRIWQAVREQLSGAAYPSSLSRVSPWITLHEERWQIRREIY